MSIQADKGPLSVPLPVPFHKNFLVLIIVIKEKKKKGPRGNDWEGRSHVIPLLFKNAVW